MLEKSDTPIAAVMKRLSNHGIEATFLVPTETGLRKSILDAIAPVRSFLKETGVHDYEVQRQGEDNKKIIEVFFVTPEGLIKTKASLYRPETKDGDPRIWFYGLNQYARASNLLAMVLHKGYLYVINASDPEILGSIDNPSSPLGEIASSAENAISPEALELLGRLKEISRKCFVPSFRNGDTGIGYTLESLLGIAANNDTAPDFKGIEIKASRVIPGSRRSRTRVNLFSQVPDWASSPVGSAYRLLEKYGYERDGRLQLYCSIEATAPNTQKLVLSVDNALQLLKTMEEAPSYREDVLCWRLAKLKERLVEKHPETFWVKAEVKEISGREHFFFHKVIHTVRPFVSNLEYLLANGTISLDLTMSARAKGTVRDHGYLFKIWPEDFPALFPPPRVHDLAS
jgi:hypothetical protein